MILRSSRPQQALLIIGMHRSGTSALARVINLHGVTLGSELPDAAFDNQAGFWENQHVVRLHERLLDALGSSWDDVRELPENWLERARSEGFVEDLITLIGAEFGAAPIWAVKDPRLCRLLPLWLQVLAHLGIESKLIFAVRDPGEVVGSLMVRNDLSAATASLLWLRHLAEPIQVSRGLSRSMIDYESLLGDWRGCMARIASELDIVFPVSSKTCESNVDAHLRRDLKHQLKVKTRELLPEIWRDALLSGHDACQALIQGDTNWLRVEARLEDMVGRFEFARPVIAELRPESEWGRMQARLTQVELDTLAYMQEAQRLFNENKAFHNEVEDANRTLFDTRSELVEARGEVAKGNARIRLLEEARVELDLIKGSRSWRLTRPLRVALRLLRHRGLSQMDREKLRRWRRGGLPAMEISPPRIISSPDLLPSAPSAKPTLYVMQQTSTVRDFFIWAVIDWHFRTQRPQHLARELAKAGHRVFYISNNFIDQAAAGFAVEPLDDDGRLFQIKLCAAGSPVIYKAPPDADVREQLRAGIGQLLGWASSRACVSLVQHPYWLETARVLPNAWVAYDCMDHHGGFADNCEAMLIRESELMRTADLLVVTSDWLYKEASKYSPPRLMVRNACQYEHFATRPERAFRDSKGRKIIGYYGAIAEWFDLDLVEKVARRFNDCLVLLVGADTCGAQQRLQRLANVEFTGEVAYASLPYYLHGFDLCMLPFLVVPLTLATNPVKVYEYLSAGKDVVSIELPEIHQFGELVRTGTDHETFLQAVSMALAAPVGPGEIARRQQFAAEQTWSHRVSELLKGIHALPKPKVSVVVVTYNNLDLTKLCLHSLEQYSDYENLEVIVVDNASDDDTPAWLTEWVKEGDERHIVLNPDNRGFAAANNQGLAVASGDYLVMLNNDTYVTPGWAATLVAHLKHNSSLGMLGPVTNNIGNEARIEIHYDSMDEMLHTAADYTTRHAGQLTSLHTAAFFCVMMPRQVYEKVGELDEAFGIGMFEDDDYCRRVQQAGWTIACADDVFVHHNLSASFNKIKEKKRQEMFEKNKAIYEAKWGTWLAHEYREQRK